MKRKLENIDLFSAIANKNIDMVNAAIKAGNKPSSTNFLDAIYTKNEAIMLAIISACEQSLPEMLFNSIKYSKNITIVNAVIKTGVKATSEDLEIAMKVGDLEIINAVIDAGAPPCDLFCAICTNNADIVGLAIKGGAEISSRNFIRACYIQNVAVVNAIIDAGFQPELSDLWMLILNGHTAIITASKAAYCDSIREMSEIAKRHPNDPVLTNFLDKLTVAKEIKIATGIITQACKTQIGFFATLPSDLLAKITCLTVNDEDNNEKYKLAYNIFNSWRNPARHSKLEEQRNPQVAQLTT